MALRVYADVNSVADGGYWCLSFEGQRLDDVAAALALQDGMPVVLYHSDEEEEFEWDGRLWHRPTGPSPAPQWVATVDEQSFRRLR